MPTHGTVSIEDASGETSTIRFNIQDYSLIPTAPNNIGSVSQDLDELKDAVALITLGEIRKVNLGKDFPESAAPVTDVNAQRERKWLVTMRDETQFLDPTNAVPNPGYLRTFQFEVPCANLALLRAGSDEIDLANATVIQFVTAVQLNIRSPWNSSALVTPTNRVISIRHVGRRI